MRRVLLVLIIIIVVLVMFAGTPVLADTPIADAGDDQTVDQNVTVTLDGSRSTGSSGVIGWNWSFGYNGSSITLAGEAVEFTFDLAGVYQVTLLVTDADGLTDTDMVTVTVRDTEPPVANAGPDIEAEMGDTIPLDGSASTDNVGIVSWSWSVTLRRIILTAEEVGETVTLVLEPGVYIANLTVTDAMGNNNTDEALVVVEWPGLPRAWTWEDHLYVEAGKKVIFDGSWSSPEDRLRSWFWTFEYEGSEVNLSGRRPSFTFITSGLYMVTLTVIDVDGYSDSAGMKVTVRDTMDPVPKIRVGAETVGPKRITLDGNVSEDSVGIVNWTWRIHHDRGTDYVHGEVVKYKHHGPGDYEVDLIVKDASGNTGVASHTFIVKAEKEVGLPLWLGIAIIIVTLSSSTIAMLYIRSRFKKEPGDPDMD